MDRINKFKEEIENLIEIFQKTGSPAAMNEMELRQKEIDKIYKNSKYKSPLKDIEDYEKFITASALMPIRGRPAKNIEKPLEKPLEIPKKPMGRPKKIIEEKTLEIPKKPMGRPKKNIEEKPLTIPKARGRPKKIIQKIEEPKIEKAESESESDEEPVKEKSKKSKSKSKSKTKSKTNDEEYSFVQNKKVIKLSKNYFDLSRPVLKKKYAILLFKKNIILDKQFYDDDVYENHIYKLHPAEVGRGLFSLEGLDKVFKGVQSTGNQISNSTKGLVMGRGDNYAPYIREIIKKYGNQEIQSMTISRNPIQTAIVKLLNVLSLGKVEQRMDDKDYDKLFHLRLIVKLKSGENIAIEKNESINIQTKPKKLPKAEFKEISNIPQGITLNNLLENAQKIMGNKYFNYSASENNCQDYIIGILSGSNIGTQEDKDFVKQDIASLFKNLGYLKNLSNKVTDLGGRFNEVLYGAGMK